MGSLLRLSEHCRAETASIVETAATVYGVAVPSHFPLASDVNIDDIDDTVVAFHSNLALASKLNLADYVRLIRGQTDTDPRPNKDLYELPEPQRTELHDYWCRWNDVVRNGVTPEWLPTRPRRQKQRPRNHSSVRDHLPQVRQHIRKGQRDGRYLVVHAGLLDHWQDVYISPVGVVDKGVTDIRLIDDYSFPEGKSVNDFTDRSNLPPIKYNPPDDIARRIDMLRRNHPHARILMMLGDVAGAFRHVPIHAEHTHMFAFIFGDYLVIDMACGFGWCGSPAYYHLAGTLINGLYEQTRVGHGDHMQSVPRSIVSCSEAITAPTRALTRSLPRSDIHLHEEVMAPTRALTRSLARSPNGCSSAPASGRRALTRSLPRSDIHLHEEVMAPTRALTRSLARLPSRALTRSLLRSHREFQVARNPEETQCAHWSELGASGGDAPAITPVSRSLSGLFWCDDHTCVELDEGTRCCQANIALRRAMATVLGPSAINERKFTQWSEHGKSLGLLWDTRNGTVTVPAEKIAKAHQRVQALLVSGRATKTLLLQVVGSLRHVASCCPPARAFFQRIQATASSSRRYGSFTLSRAVLEDLKWFRYVLRHQTRFNGIPVTLFAGVYNPKVHVHTDASDEGLCALEPALRQFIRVRFHDSAKMQLKDNKAANSINARELQSAVLAVLVWGPVWAQSLGPGPIEVRFWIDNVSAVSWTQRRCSRQPLSQTYNRLLSLAEFQYLLHCTAMHVPGVDNTMADAGRSAKPLRESLDVLGSVLYRHAMADTTNITYSVHWRQWTSFSRYMKWSKWLSNNPQDNSNKLGLFAIFCWRYGWSSRRVGNQYATIRLKVSSIRWFHRRFAGTELEVSPDFNILMRGIRKLSDPPRKKQPITPAFLRLLYRRLDFTRPRNRLLWGSVLLAYFFLLRRSEFLLVGSMRHSYCLKASNAYFSDDRGVPVPVKIANAVTIGLSDAKNDQFGRGAWRTMHATGDSVLCPLQALTHVLRARSELGHARATHLCVDLTANEVSTSFKALATDVGAPRGHYSTHSVRIGGATALVRGKADSLSIKLIGRWMSNCYESYPVLSAEATQGLSARMI